MFARPLGILLFLCFVLGGLGANIPTYIDIPSLIFVVILGVAAMLMSFSAVDIFHALETFLLGSYDRRKLLL